MANNQTGKSLRMVRALLLLASTMFLVVARLLQRIPACRLDPRPPLGDAFVSAIRSSQLAFAAIAVLFAGLSEAVSRVPYPPRPSIARLSATRW